MQRPGAEAALQKGVAELRFARGRIGEVSEWAVERFEPVGEAGIHHRAHRVVPKGLLEEWTVRRRPSGGVRQHAVIGMAAADAGRLHATRSGEVGGPKTHAVHARRGSRNRFDVVHALGRLEDGVDEDGLYDAML